MYFDCFFMCQALYQVVLYMLAQLIFITVWKEGTIIIPIFQMRPFLLGSERESDLPKTIQLVYGKARSRTQVSLCSTHWRPWACGSQGGSFCCRARRYHWTLLQPRENNPSS